LPKDELTRMFLDELAERGLEPVSLSSLLSSGEPLRRAKFG
jgi:hypothetical protein